MTTVAIQGERASFHDIAATKYYSNDVTLVSCNTFEETFLAVKNGKAKYGVVAIENSLYGSITETYDLLVKYGYSISGEIYLRVEQCLIGIPSANIADIAEVHSHPVALAQCDHYLENYMPNSERVEAHDTAGSVAQIAKFNNPKIAAIASKQAADLYGMEVLAESIETNKQNYTRFVVIEQDDIEVKSPNKTSLIFKTSHKPGALHAALGAFAERSINISKLQSRPIIGKAWHYIFYVDVETGINDANFTEAINDLNDQDCHVTILGSYTSGAKV